MAITLARPFQSGTIYSILNENHRDRAVIRNLRTAAAERSLCRGKMAEFEEELRPVSAPEELRPSKDGTNAVTESD